MNFHKQIMGLVLVIMLAGCSGSSSSNKRNSIPSASFTFICVDLSCDFDASGSADSDGTIDSYDWSFNQSGVMVSNTFASGGMYTVTLTVSDNQGAASSSSQDVTVIDPPTNFTGFTKTQFATDANSEPAEINDVVFTDLDQENEAAYDDLLNQ